MLANRRRKQRGKRVLAKQAKQAKKLRQQGSMPAAAEAPAKG
jgi:hypothetical protein